MRIEITFSSGKFIAWDEVIPESVDTSKSMVTFQVKHPKYDTNTIIVDTDKVDFLEIMY